MPTPVRAPSAAQFGSRLDPQGILMPPHGRAEVEARTNWPKGPFSDRQLRNWELSQLVVVDLPAPLLLDWDHSQSRTTVRVHEVASAAARLAFGEIHSSGLWASLVDFSGDWVVRKKKGAWGLSMHGYGLALDFDADHNAQGTPAHLTHFGGTPEGLRVVEIMESWGWLWGGRWPTPDAMHFQWATGI